MKKWGILVDSGGIIKNDTEIENTNIEVIPLHVVLEDKTEFTDTPDNIEKFDVLKRLEDKEDITTSMASPGEIEEKYREMLKKYEKIIFLTITSNLSSMKNTSLMVANDDEFKDRVFVMDHFTAANGIKYLALKLNKMINDGIDDIKEFQKTADLATKKIFLGLIPGDIKKLNKGGRTSNVLLGILKIIKTKFLIRWGEKPKNISINRTVRGIVLKAATVGNEVSGEDCLFLLVHSGEYSIIALENAKKTLDSLNIKYKIELIPSIYTCHAGNETIGVITISKDLM